jgi:translation initiation factor 1
MSNKNKHKSGIVFSTATDFNFSFLENEQQDTLPNDKQQLKVFLDRKGGGKLVSRVTGFVGSNEALDKLGSELKKWCGGGGSVKDFEILIQGDHRDKIVSYLTLKQYKVKKAGG